MSKDKLEQIKSSEETMGKIFAHVANGGTLIDLCQEWGVEYDKIAIWVYSDNSRTQIYQKSIDAGSEWQIKRILKELQDLATIDIRSAYDDAGCLKDMKKWPKALAGSVKQIEIFEEYQGSGKEREYIGRTKRVTFWDKIRAIELLGKNLQIFIDRIEHGGSVTLEQLVAGTEHQTEGTAVLDNETENEKTDQVG